MRLLTRSAFLVGSLLVWSGARADITLPDAAPPPQADAVTIRVLRGGEATIPLRGHYGGSGGVDFRIVRRPAHGRLAEINPEGENRASVAYVQDGDAAASDEFRYVVEGDGRVSLPAVVHIEVNEPPAHLRLPDEIDFGEVVLGASAVRSCTIGNDGGGTLQGSLTISSPWHLSATTYKVAAGETETVTVTFTPEEPGDCVGQITLLTPAGAAAGTVSLGGRSIAPLRIAPNPLALIDQRRAMLFVTNLTDQPMILNFQTGPHFQPIETLELAPKEDRDVMVELAPKVQRHLDETIMVKGVHFAMPLRVEFSPAEAKAAATPEPSATPAAAVTPIPAPPPPTAAPVAPLDSPGTSLAERVSARRLGSSRWQLHWAAAQEPGATYRIEERQLALNANDDLLISWRKIAASQLAVKDGQVRAEVVLDGRKLHMLRVAALGADGAVLWDSPLVALSPRPAPSHAQAYLLWLLIAGLAAFVYLRWRGGRSFA